MPIGKLYAIARSELAKDLVFEIDDEPVTLSIKGLLIAQVDSKSYNFSFFELSESEFVLAVQMKGFIVYLAMEADEEIDEEAYPELVRILLEQLTPAIAFLVTRAEKDYTGKADLLLDDDMSPSLKEFFYGLLMKYRKGRPVYEQTEVA
ncbi:hypothetical protein CL1_0550 [Thermococcus cleftensis]|uniref:Uncharacterized protein n=1 Tax=Thermococcus cleftensis (strain DSM 27260 / KACC 17922 / CL1) TaxID=163003 RepID=I3ZSS4_THECF|nr:MULTISPECIES: hypothetical protein [Thermococcus]AFL94758.1 hypothetical protein CL1_0550 [Thermococcus cleftensis]NJE03557.1 hypothetical protein [Thermococcus sp. MV11]